MLGASSSAAADRFCVVTSSIRRSRLICATSAPCSKLAACQSAAVAEMAQTNTSKSAASVTIITSPGCRVCCTSVTVIGRGLVSSRNAGNPASICASSAAICARMRARLTRTRSTSASAAAPRAPTAAASAPCSASARSVRSLRWRNNPASAALPACCRNAACCSAAPATLDVARCIVTNTSSRMLSRVGAPCARTPVHRPPEHKRKRAHRITPARPDMVRAVTPCLSWSGCNSCCACGPGWPPQQGNIRPKPA